MPIAINGSGTITGVSVGGLPDGIVDTDMIAANAVTAPKRGTGAILQVVQGYDTNFTRAATSSSSYVATTHSVTITPTQANSKILITFSGDANNNGNGNYLLITVFRSVNGGTFSDISELGQSGGNSNGFMIVNGSSSRIEVPFCINFLDSPSYSVGNAIVYKIYFKGNTGGGNLEIPSSGDNQPVIGIAREIAA